MGRFADGLRGTLAGLVLYVAAACSGSVALPPQPTPAVQQNPQIVSTAPAPTIEDAVQTPSPQPVLVPEAAPLEPTPVVTPDAVPSPVPLPFPTPAVTPVLTPVPTLSPAPPATSKPTPAPTAAPLDVPRPDVAPYTQNGSSGPIVVGTPRQLGVKPVFAGDERLYVAYSVQNLARKGSPVPSFPTEFYGSAFVAGLELRIDGHVADNRSFSLAPGGNVTFSMPLEDAVRKVLNETGVFLAGGTRKFELALGTANADFPPLAELNTANNSASANLAYRLAKLPVPKRVPQSDIEAKIQYHADNYTWFTEQNKSDLIAILKGHLKDVPINWSMVALTILPFDDYNKKFGDALGKTQEEKEINAAVVARTPLRGAAFVEGSSSSQRIFIREGILPQVLIAASREFTGAYYMQKNPVGVVNGAPSNAHEFIITVGQIYFAAKLTEDSGWGGLTNVSYLEGTSSAAGYVTSLGLQGQTVRRAWVLASQLKGRGYDPNNIPSSVWLEEYNKLVAMQDPTSTVIRLDEEAKKLKPDYIQELIRERVSDVPPVPLPDKVRMKIDPQGTFGKTLSLDRIISVQLEAGLPGLFNYGTIAKYSVLQN